MDPEVVVVHNIADIDSDTEETIQPENQGNQEVIQQREEGQVNQAVENPEVQEVQAPEEPDILANNWKIFTREKQECIAALKELTHHAPQSTDIWQVLKKARDTGKTRGRLIAITEVPYFLPHCAGVAFFTNKREIFPGIVRVKLVRV